MARYYVAFESMKRFMKLKSCDSISDLVSHLCDIVHVHVHVHCISILYNTYTVYMYVHCTCH